MSKDLGEKIIKILKLLLQVEDIEIIKCTIESIIENIEEEKHIKSDKEI